MTERVDRRPGRRASILTTLGFAATIATGLGLTEGAVSGFQPQRPDNSPGSITMETISVPRTRITNPDITIFLNEPQRTDSAPINSLTQKSTLEADTEQAILPEAGTQNPDIVIVLMDDLSPYNMGFWKRFPTIRKEFIENGVTFKNARGETSLCCPGRAGLYTGQHTFNHGVKRNGAGVFKPS